MDQNLKIDVLAKKMILDYEQIGKYQNEIFAVRSNFRKYLEEELQKLLSYLEKEDQFEENLIGESYESFVEYTASNRAKILCENTYM